MAGPVYPYRDRRYDHLYPWGDDGKGLGTFAATQLAGATAAKSLSQALFFPEGREVYVRKLNALIASFDDAP